MLLFTVPALLFIGWVIGQPWWVARRRERLRQRPFPHTWRHILRRRMPYLRRMPVDLQLQLKQHIQVFLAEKPFIGCGGLTVNDDMRVTIAAQACLLLLNRRPSYYPSLRQILVYPGAFFVDRVHSDGAGVLQDQRRLLSGESWSQGQVILSWQDALDGAAVSDDGRNVVIHEFAHQLDQETGHANGAPRLPTREHYERWSGVFQQEFESLQRQLALGGPSLFGAYAATDPAEFFAVASEVFFEQAARMALECPALYRELARFYRVDPVGW
ncbi:zinc-dependent peptidase [Piscinibacter sp. XHJ-5]|uniref:M90 family metallopeptidase n=1 Tax=Piscinibacter sp. XHJ-5 TaxID=3037797 RepID=UPI0024534921|nr:zinc-dependent peptidase [Piscinibacter sp. XHJ-5]